MAKYRVFSGPYFPVLSPNKGKYGPEKIMYLDTLFTQWTLDSTHRSHRILAIIYDGELCNNSKRLKVVDNCYKALRLRFLRVLTTLPNVFSDTRGYDTYWKGILPVVIAYKITPLK